MLEQTFHQSAALKPCIEGKLSFQMLLVVGLILVYIGRAQEIFSSLAVLQVAVILQVLALLFILKNIAQSSRLLNTTIKESKLLLTLFLWGVVAACTTHYLRASILFVLKDFLRIFLFYIFITAAIQNTSHLRTAVWAYILSMVMLAIPSLYARSEGRWRSLDASYDANDIALLFVTTLPFILYLIPVTRGIRKILLLVFVPLLIYALFATGSRGGLVGMVAVISMVLYKSKFNIFLKTTAAVVVVLLLLLYLPETLSQRLATVTEADYNQTDAFGRVNIWKRSMTLVAHNPVLGVGPGCFAIANGFAFGDNVGGAAWDMTAHNSFLLITVEMGVVGGGIYMCFLGANLASMRRIQRKALPGAEQQDLWLARALEVSLIGFIVSGFFLSFCYNPVSYFLVSLGVAYRSSLSSGGTATLDVT